MGALRRLPPVPAGRLAHGLWAGALDRDPRSGRRGRTRRWSYTAAGSDEVALGAAIVDLGFAATAFAWCHVDGRMLTWAVKAMPWTGVVMGHHAGVDSSLQVRDAAVAIAADGSLELDVPVERARLVASVDVDAGTPAVCATPTPGGGWNTTQKTAGEVARIEVHGPTGSVRASGGSWRDWTLGAQDRRTTWRWAAGAGTAADGRRVGLNVSTGMNGAVGEDVVWWDDVPYALDLATLAPVGGDPAGDWRLDGPGWRLAMASHGARTADENLLLVRSRYVQPVGRFTGTLPDPGGRPVDVTLVGVTEDHEARW